MVQAVEEALVVRMEASLRKFERQMEGGRKAAEKAALGSEKAWKRAGNQIAANADRAQSGISRMTNISGRGRFVLQNTANQIGDIAVQMGAGTSASRALGQQLPQLFGGFGALGGALGLLGPIMGTVAALGIPLAAALFSFGNQAEDTEDQIKGLEAAVSSLRASQDRASQSRVDLVGQYGGLADEARAIFEIDRQIQAIRASNAVDAASRGVAGELGVAGVFGFEAAQIRDLEQTLKGLREEKARLDATPASLLSDEDLAEANRRIDEIADKISDLSTVRGNIDDLAEAFGISEDAAREVVAQFAAIGQARGPAEQAQAMSDLADFVFSASRNLADATDEGEALYDQFREVVIQALELSKIDLATPISEAVSEASKLAQELAIARGIRLDALTNNPDFFDPRNENGLTGVIIRDRGVPRENTPGYTPPRTRSGGSRGGGGASVVPGLKEAERLYQSTQSEAERYAAEVERINELHRQFPEIITNDVRDKAIAALDESAKDLGRMVETLEQNFENAFAEFVTGAANAKEAAQQLISTLAKMAIQGAVGGLNISGLFGGLFSGSVPGFANGTDFAPGGMAMVGERGPELVNLPRGSQVIPNHRLGGVGGSATLTIHAPEGFTVEQQGAIQGIAVEVTQASLQHYDRNVAPTRHTQISNDPRRRG